MRAELKNSVPRNDSLKLAQQQVHLSQEETKEKDAAVSPEHKKLKSLLNKKREQAKRAASFSRRQKLFKITEESQGSNSSQASLFKNNLKKQQSRSQDLDHKPQQ